MTLLRMCIFLFLVFFYLEILLVWLFLVMLSFFLDPVHIINTVYYYL